MGESLMVGMSEIKVTNSPEDVLVALGLGSCVGVCAFDMAAQVAGLAHIVLPDSTGHEPSPGKFANSAVPLLFETMCAKGASMKNIKVAIAGGAQLFAFNGTGPRLEIGPRNAAAVQEQLKLLHLNVLAADIGGSVGRTVHLFGDGKVRVKTIGRGEVDLTSLGLLSGKLGIVFTPSNAPAVKV